VLTKCETLGAALSWSYRLAAEAEGLSNRGPPGRFDAPAATGDARELNRRHATTVVIRNGGAESRIPGAIVPSQATRHSCALIFLYQITIRLNRIVVNSDPTRVLYRSIICYTMDNNRFF
jgi:hypothetical protein